MSLSQSNNAKNLLLGLVTVLLFSCQPQIESTPPIVSTKTQKTFIETSVTTTPTQQPQNIGEDEVPFYLGVDLSYVNEMDDCGAVYLEDGELRDAYELSSEHGANLVRARLWHTPDWTNYSTLDDVERTFSRAHVAGMDTLLAFHYSDNWADPGKQAIPAAWEDFSEEELPDVLYQYTYEVLMRLHDNGLFPDFVQVGNEINSGLVKHESGLDWPRDAALINAGIRAIRDIILETGSKTRVVLHVAQPENAGWWFREAREHNVTYFDVIGLSYYPQWSSFLPGDLGPHVSYLHNEFDKEVLIVETAYPWTLEKIDETADNILYQGIRGYPISIEGQRQFMIDLTQSLIMNGGLGVVYWEPAWVSTECTTRWGQGSHWENATFFDFNNNNAVHEGIDFLAFDYHFPKEIVDGIIDESYGVPLIQDERGDNFDQVPHLDLLDLYVRDDAQTLYLGLTTAGNIFADPWGSYLIYFDTTGDDQGSEVDVDRRPITAAEPFLPEYRLDISMDDRKSTVSGTYELYSWNDTTWETVMMTVAAAIKPGSPSVIELQMQKSVLANPEFVNLGVVSVGRGSAHSAGDILGEAKSITDWNEAILFKTFARYDMKASD